MKAKIILSSFCIMTLAAIICAAVIVSHKQPRSVVPAHARTFQVHGQIRAVDPAQRMIRIAHEEIPGYMPAMTMPFTVKNADILTGLAVGEAVQFELVVTEDDAWISHIEKITEDQPADTNGVKSASAQDAATEQMHSGEMMPDFDLIDQNGHPIHLKDFHGQVVVLTFIYTRCPLPNFCPLMSRNFVDLQQRLNKEFPGRYHLLSITMDPEFDRPEVLKEYAKRQGADEKDWTFATGDAGQIHFVAGLMGLYYQKENGLITHDLRTAVIGPDGHLVQLWKSNLWTPYEVQRVVRGALDGTAEGRNFLTTVEHR